MFEMRAFLIELLSNFKFEDAGFEIKPTHALLQK